jgi:hypothetical protein
MTTRAKALEKNTWSLSEKYASTVSSSSSKSPEQSENEDDDEEEGQS